MDLPPRPYGIQGRSTLMRIKVDVLETGGHVRLKTCVTREPFDGIGHKVVIE